MKKTTTGPTRPFNHPGGRASMAPKSGAAPVVPGRVTTGGRPGNSAFGHAGGNSGVAGNTGARPARPA